MGRKRYRVGNQAGVERERGESRMDSGSPRKIVEFFMASVYRGLRLMFDEPFVFSVAFSVLCLFPAGGMTRYDIAC